jgi:hypothetical protein
MQHLSAQDKCNLQVWKGSTENVRGSYKIVLLIFESFSQEVNEINKAKVNN